MFLNEYFASIQGEGRFAGTPAFFLRFQGCPVHCHFCDTKNSWERGFTTKDDRCSPQDILALVRNMAVLYPKIKHVVLTGGEPFFQDQEELGYLIFQLFQLGFTIQVETSGIVEPTKSMIPWLGHSHFYLTLSPKAPTPEQKYYESVHFLFPLHAQEIKFPVADSLDIDFRIPAFLQTHEDWLAPRSELRYYLQPVDFGQDDQNSLPKKLCLDLAMQKSWNVSVQAHKMLNCR